MGYIYRRNEGITREPVAPYVLRADIPHDTKKRPRRKDFNPELCGTTKGRRKGWRRTPAHTSP